MDHRDEPASWRPGTASVGTGAGPPDLDGPDDDQHEDDLGYVAGPDDSFSDPAAGGPGEPGFGPAASASEDRQAPPDGPGSGPAVSDGPGFGPAVSDGPGFGRAASASDSRHADPEPPGFGRAASASAPDEPGFGDAGPQPPHFGGASVFGATPAAPGPAGDATPEGTPGSPAFDDGAPGFSGPDVSGPGDGAPDFRGPAVSGPGDGASDFRGPAVSEFGDRGPGASVFDPPARTPSPDAPAGPAAFGGPEPGAPGFGPAAGGPGFGPAPDGPGFGGPELGTPGFGPAAGGPGFGGSPAGTFGGAQRPDSFGVPDAGTFGGPAETGPVYAAGPPAADYGPVTGEFRSDYAGGFGPAPEGGPMPGGTAADAIYGEQAYQDVLDHNAGYQQQAPPFPAQYQPPASTRSRLTASLRMIRPRRKPAKQADHPGRQAQLTVARIEPWSVMKFSFVISLVAFIVLFVAVAVLYAVLSGLGVFGALEHTVENITSSQGSAGFNLGTYLSAARVLGYTGLLGAINVVLITAICTVGSVLYNLTTNLAGGIEVTLKETD